MKYKIHNVTQTHRIQRTANLYLLHSKTTAQTNGSCSHPTTLFSIIFSRLKEVQTQERQNQQISKSDQHFCKLFSLLPSSNSMERFPAVFTDIYSPPIAVKKRCVNVWHVFSSLRQNQKSCSLSLPRWQLWFARSRRRVTDYPAGGQSNS